ncbi:DUF4276 family protein [Frankia sp. CiP3]|uniref:DUF4276 family protein n=1 Tax=Frankia sp. CiP3 TaxID=2880971 RepID=UPI001EF729F1|nr:DUF4276 family protein [Frankia sp. CiP3]
MEPAPIIALVVEGTGEISAVPLLLRRLAHDMFGCWSARFLRPSRYGRGQLTTTGGIERIIERTVVLNPDATGVLVMLDADDDCPAALAPRLLDRARRARPDRRLSVVLPNREFEAWFLAAASSLAGVRGLAPNVETHPAPENPRDCKGWLTRHRDDGQQYQAPVDQAALAAQIDLEMARRNSPSFDKLCRDLNWLLTPDGPA